LNSNTYPIILPFKDTTLNLVLDTSLQGNEFKYLRNCFGSDHSSINVTSRIAWCSSIPIVVYLSTRIIQPGAELVSGYHPTMSWRNMYKEIQDNHFEFYKEYLMKKTEYELILSHNRKGARPSAA
jgi:hypothetical protein